MKIKKSAKPVVANAIIWASMMIASSLLMAEQSQGQSMMMLILFIGGWFATNNLMAESKQFRVVECAYIRRLMGRSK